MKLPKYLFILSLLFFLDLFFLPTKTLAIVDPTSVPNNKFGIHIISASPDEASEAAALVNSSGGDWGYVTVLIQSDDRKLDRWQTFFDDLRVRHLIPIVRIANTPDGNNWKVPDQYEADSWANFLDSLNWPTKNRYVVIYNEPNQAHEWGGTVDPGSYAKILDQTINVLKAKNSDFFVLNAGFDASAPNEMPNFEDEKIFLDSMNQTVPGIFNKLDGWVSHSYPGHNYSDPPTDSGRGGIKTYLWEESILKQDGLTKNLPVFITETGWKHAEGLNYDGSLPSASKVASDYEQAFANFWNDPNIVAVTPFLLNYQQVPFDHFSFKQITGEPQSKKILGISSLPFYDPFFTIQNMAKVGGSPTQENRGELIDGSVYASLVIGQSYQIPLQFKNTGQSIWGKNDQIFLKADSTSPNLIVDEVPLSDDAILPGGRTAFVLKIKGDIPGTYKLSLQLYKKDQPMLVQPLEFTTEIKSPIKIKVFANLLYKSDPSGNYSLSFISLNSKGSDDILINSDGNSKTLEEKLLLPDQDYQITLSTPFYFPKTIQTKLTSGLNFLNFDTLTPNLLSAITQPTRLWQLLPFSN